MRSFGKYFSALGITLLLCVSLTAAGDPDRDAYTAALAQERAVRVPNASLEKMRAVVAKYEAIPRRFPRSGYSDNALWQGAVLAIDAFYGFGQDRDRETAVRLLRALARSYPSSSLRPDALDLMTRVESSGKAAAKDPPAPKRTASAPPATPPAPTSTTSTSVAAPAPVQTTAQASAAAPKPATPKPQASKPAESPKPTITGITRQPLPDGVRITVELDAEVPYRAEQITNPDRLFFDFTGAQAAGDLRDTRLIYEDDLVPEIRLGRQSNNTTRVVLDLKNVSRHSVFVIHNPYRIVIDCERGPLLARGVPSSTVTPVNEPAHEAPPAIPAPARPVASAPIVAADQPAAGVPDEGDSSRPPIAVAEPTVPAAAINAQVPKPPSTNGSGGFSLARQLGLGVSRIAIDPGHGGHDPGAHGSRGNEAELVLDVALRLEKLLLKQPGVEVVMTRRSDVYVPLEERTAIANRERADLFLSIHANASNNSKLGGVETYFLDFASSPDAEQVAARENSASGRVMNNLPDIVKAIALNNKLDESRDLAGMVQDAMMKRLQSQNKALRSLGVKRAPFVVLIGAGMPSVLSEISFITNKTEGPLLATNRYRERIAEALAEAVLRYRKALKAVTTASLQ